MVCSSCTERAVNPSSTKKMGLAGKGMLLKLGVALKEWAEGTEADLPGVT